MAPLIVKRPIWEQNKGLSLIEVLISIFILTIGILSTLLFFSHAMIMAEFAGDLTVASSHADYILEEMVGRKSLANVTGTDWESWAQEQGLNSLPQEKFQVSFNNVLTNPLDVETTVNWVRRARVNNVTFITRIAK